MFEFRTVFERWKRKVLTLLAASPEPELSAFGIVQVELEQMRSDLATLQESIDTLHAKFDTLQTVNTFQPAPASDNSFAENEMLAQVTTVNTLETKPAAKRRKTPARK